ncbi:UDP-glycosyltransferase [Gramella sp. GC03-9]|uniref:UDP-glycosyltransferase n=1 Tax=Christiangramia oceanisediminis TaxID=2920386 RepID=A0A9X2KX68_9FLAO|nr:UDP-glycosyltransferase [Gramella oceanisediminis]MCP9198301.1 UDP-glycosyltransferase [Gramella oceanisediminis]
MKKKKILVIIPDGVSLRNFLFTDFPDIAREAGLQIVYWNATTYDIAGEGEKEIKLKPRPRVITDLYKRAKILAELDHFKDRFRDPIYEKYEFRNSSKGIKNKIKNLIVSWLRRIHSGEKGLEVLRSRIIGSERKSQYYKDCREVLKNEAPDLVFCANQRPVNAIAPVTAAKDLGIPTACFIFSWDNLPKATKVIDTDFYFVWSNYMKNELLEYYPFIQEQQVKITGTPQFEIHYKEEVIMSRKDFFKKYGLNPEKDYLCFSGDDITTSPHDEIFLKDVAETVRKLNRNGEELGVIFRRCPVDFSERYDTVIEEYSDVIKPVDPEWSGGEGSWDQVMPTRADMILQTNIIQHSFMVINVASSMVFDFATRDKACAYINYIPDIPNLKKDVREIYEYVHFRSMPDRGAVYWINEVQEIEDVIMLAKNNTSDSVEITKQWYKIINASDGKANSQITQEFQLIIK